MQVAKWYLVQTAEAIEVYLDEDLMSIINLTGTISVKAHLQHLEEMYRLKPGTLLSLFYK